MSATVLRITRHEITNEQMEALKAVFGDVAVVEHSEPMPTDPNEFRQKLQALIEQHQPAAIEVVLPIHLLGLACAETWPKGIKLLRSRMERVGKDNFKFLGYEYVYEIIVRTEQVGPQLA